MTVDPINQFSIVDLQQGTPEWKRWRAGGIGASDAPTIMGENPWKSAEKLRFEKTNPKFMERQNRMNQAMARGVALEPKARAEYCELRDIEVHPLCIQNREHLWMRCSLDGICLQTMKAVEIKCGDSAYKRTDRSRAVPSYYYGQLQHIMAVTGLNEVDFFCYLPDRIPILVECERNGWYIKKLIERELEFWESIRR